MLKANNRGLRKVFKRFLKLNGGAVHLTVWNKQNGDLLYALHKIKDLSGNENALHFDYENQIIFEFCMQSSEISQEYANERLKMLEYYNKFQSKQEINEECVFCEVPKSVSAKVLLNLTIEVVTHIHGTINTVDYELVAY